MENKTILSLFQALVGEFDNFQQVWQQNTDTEIHVLKTDSPHNHFHLTIEKLEPSSDFEAIFSVNFMSDKEKITEIWQFKDEQMFIENQSFEIAFVDEVWTIQNTDRTIEIAKNRLKILDSGYFSNAEKVAFKMNRCRFFTGWIEIPDPENAEKIYRFPNLRLHDQGDSVQLVMPDGSLGKYTVELTQLVFGHTIFIMKLAVYELPKTDLEINSHSIAYTWTNPEAERIGINLRYIISGWTLENTGLGVSKNP